MKLIVRTWALTAMGLGIAAAQVQPVSRALSVPIQKIVLDDKTFDDALRELVHQSGAKVVIAFEPSATSAANVPRLQLSLENGTVEQVLTALCAIDSRYTFSEGPSGVIEVRPLKEVPELQMVLNLPVSSLKLHVREWAPNLIARLPEFIPELGQYLNMKALEWGKRSGRAAPGSPGATMTTNVTPPLISIQLESTTVRGVLNAIAAYTLLHATEKSAPVYLPGSGWRIDFAPDAQAPTGLGGYIKWSTFP
jgi:hypothetical protein